MDNTQRFSNRVQDYILYRPHYPDAVVSYLETTYGLTADIRVADIGAGTGISTALFLQHHYNVMAVEPNKEMREAMVSLLSGYPGFEAIDGTAEDTQLPDASIDLAVSAQAFHWFDREKAKKEFERIIKPDGVLALIWNERAVDSDFEREYDELITTYGIDYKQVDHRNIGDKDIEQFFEPYPCQLASFDNYQLFDFPGLKGRLCSSSYMPLEGQQGYAPMIAALRHLFDKYQQEGKIRINYATKVYSGRLHG